jgi:hypothetical protein
VTVKIYNLKGTVFVERSSMRGVDAVASPVSEEAVGYSSGP